MKIERGFRCGPERHLWRYGLELAVYQKIAAITWVKSRQEYGLYYSSVEQIAQFFDIKHQSAQRAVKNLVRRGWLVQVEPKGEKKTNPRALNAENFRSKNYQVVSHEAWTKKHPHPEHCFIKEAMPWDGETKDALALALYRDSKGNVKWYANFLVALRKTGIPDRGIERAWNDYVASWDKEPYSARGWQSKAGRFVHEFCEASKNNAKNP